MPNNPINTYLFIPKGEEHKLKGVKRLAIGDVNKYDFSSSHLIVLAQNSERMNEHYRSLCSDEGYVKIKLC